MKTFYTRPRHFLHPQLYLQDNTKRKIRLQKTTDIESEITKLYQKFYGLPK